MPTRRPNTKIHEGSLQSQIQRGNKSCKESTKTMVGIRKQKMVLQTILPGTTSQGDAHRITQKVP